MNAFLKVLREDTAEAQLEFLFEIFRYVELAQDKLTFHFTFGQPPLEVTLPRYSAKR